MASGYARGSGGSGYARGSGGSAYARPTSLGAALAHNASLSGSAYARPTSLGAALQHNANLTSGKTTGGHSHGVMGFLGNLGSDAVHAVTGIPGGVAQVGQAFGHDFREFGLHPSFFQDPKHPSHVAAIGAGIGKSYAQTYGPLAHGDLNQFLHQLYGHPLGPMLDAATLATLGGGAVARGGSVLARIGGEGAVAAREARLAKASKIAVPGFSARAVREHIPTSELEHPAGAGFHATPVTTRSLQTRLDALNGRHDELLNKIAGGYTSADAKGITASRNAQVGKLARKGLPPLQTVKAEARAYAERQLEGLIRTRPHDPLVQRLVAERTEATRLTQELAARADARTFMANPPAPADVTPRATADSVLIKNAARNPVIRARQQAVNKLLNALAPGTPLVGSTARATRALKGTSSVGSERLAGMVQPFSAAYSKLNPERQAAFHMISNGVHPQQLVDYWRAQAAKGVPIPEGAFRVLGSPKVAHLVDNFATNPDARLAKALAARDKITPALHEARVKSGLINEHTAAERPYFMLRMLNGARPVLDEHGRMTGLEDQPGRGIPQLAQELEDKGMPQPSYLPMRAEVNRASGRPLRVRTKSTIVPQSPIKRLRGMLLQNGLLSFHDTLSPEFFKQARWDRRADLHDALMQHAVRLAPDHPLPHDWEFLKSKAGEHIRYTDQVRGEFEHNLQKTQPFDFRALFTTRNHEDPAVATDAAGGKLIVPRQAADALNEEIHRTGAVGRLLYNKPTVFWKHLVLGLRPAFAVNLTVGNHILSMAQAPSLVRFATAYLNQLPGRVFEKALGAKISRATMEHVFPEQAYGSFGRQEGYAIHPVGGALKKAYQGVMPPTIAIENFLRRAFVESWVHDSPQMRTLLRANGGDINAALVKAADIHPELIREISRRTDAALGNYRQYSAAEQRIKQVIPFYGWDRHIVKSSGRILSEYPQRADVARNLGEQGHAQQDQTLGELPSYMQGDIGLGHLPVGVFGSVDVGRTPVLQTKSLNPFNTAADLGELAAALVHGKAGAHSDLLASGLNPLLQGLIEQMTGRSLLTGGSLAKRSKTYGALGNALYNIAAGVPQARLAAALLGKGPKPDPGTLYQGDARTALLNYLGVPIKKPNLTHAHISAQNEQRGTP